MARPDILTSIDVLTRDMVAVVINLITEGKHSLTDSERKAIQALFEYSDRIKGYRQKENQNSETQKDKTA